MISILSAALVFLTLVIVGLLRQLEYFTEDRQRLQWKVLGLENDNLELRLEIDRLEKNFADEQERRISAESNVT